MNNLTLDEIRQLVRNGDKIDQSVANRLTLSMMAEIANDVGEMKKSMFDMHENTNSRMKGIQNVGEKQYAEIKNVVSVLCSRLDIIEFNPSITWLLRYKTKQTIGVVLALFVFFSLSITYTPGLLAALVGVFAP